MRLTDIERAICEKDPPLPSHAIDGADTLTPSIAETRNTTANRLRRILRGDLDNIVLMAMRKEPERRYGSSQQMASDIQRYLDGKPVIARRDTRRSGRAPRAELVEGSASRTPAGREQRSLTPGLGSPLRRVSRRGKSCKRGCRSLPCRRNAVR
jgi:hypothetical protein